MKFLNLALAALSFAGGSFAVAETSAPIHYVSFGRDFVGTADPKHRIIYGFSLPQSVNLVTDFIGQVVAPAEYNEVGVALGGPNSVAITGHHANGRDNIVGSVDYLDGRYTIVPSTVSGPTLSTLQSTVNETHWTWTYLCKDCVTWSLDGLAQQFTSLVVKHPQAVLDDDSHIMGTWNLEGSQFHVYRGPSDYHISGFELDFTSHQHHDELSSGPFAIEAGPPGKWVQSGPIFGSGHGTTTTQPTLAAHRGYLFTSGRDKEGSLWYARGTNSAWDQRILSISGSRSADGGALMDVDGTLHMVYPSASGNQLLHLIFNDGLQVWEAGSPIAANTIRQPALASFKGRLVCLFYETSSGSNTMYIGNYDASTKKWSTFSPIILGANAKGESTWGLPALFTSYQGSMLNIFYVVNKDSRPIRHLSSAEIASGWLLRADPNEQSAFGVTATQSGNWAVLGFQSNNGKGEVMVAFLELEGPQWHFRENAAGAKTWYTPACAALDGYITCVFAGRDQSTSLWQVQRSIRTTSS
ncbi:CBD9-like protein [Mycena chlorophos]|uniref:CBD9-like protein n=1 Tax=Mycena chlorophos TaxID=658473 RepID=A0A8H6TGW7_MYCCL|nr:CBD9-like protein [Mycena chlorophos]